MVKAASSKKKEGTIGANFRFERNNVMDEPEERTRMEQPEYPKKI